MAAPIGKGLWRTRLNGWRRRRFAVLAVLLVVVLLAGVSVGTFALSVWVTTNVELTGNTALSASETSNCNGWLPQVSFDGYLHCSIFVGCTANTFGNIFVGPATASSASDVIVSPSGSVNVKRGQQVTFQVSGQLGYSGFVTIYLNA